MQIYIFHATVVFLESSACNQERVSMVVHILTELAHTLVCIPAKLSCSNSQIRSAVVPSHIFSMLTGSDS